MERVIPVRKATKYKICERMKRKIFYDFIYRNMDGVHVRLENLNLIKKSI